MIYGIYASNQRQIFVSYESESESDKLTLCYSCRLLLLPEHMQVNNFSYEPLGHTTRMHNGIIPEISRLGQRSGDVLGIGSSRMSLGVAPKYDIRY